MNAAYRHRGHPIDLDVHELLAGRSRCTCFIDANDCFEADADAVELEGLNAFRKRTIERAHTLIDALDSMMSAAAVSG